MQQAYHARKAGGNTRQPRKSVATGMQTMHRKHVNRFKAHEIESDSETDEEEDGEYEVSSPMSISLSPAPVPAIACLNSRLNLSAFTCFVPSATLTILLRLWCSVNSSDAHGRYKQELHSKCSSWD
jgi:hypothetical protein